MNNLKELKIYDVIDILYKQPKCYLWDKQYNQWEEDDITTAKCEYSRNISFDDITFKIGNDWLPREDLPEVNNNWL